jgi:outer membrane immunogenic protein
MGKLLAVTTALALVAGIGCAAAADMPLKAPPAPPPAPLWNGFYFGINGGHGRLDATWYAPTTGFYANAVGQSFSTTPKGWLVGGQIGYYWQGAATPLVFGLELAGDWADWSETLTGPLSPSFPADKFTTKLRDEVTAMGKIGLAFANVLFYIEGGAAAGTVEFSAISGPPVPNVTFATTQTGGGVAGGGGIETLWGQHVLLGVEYKWIDLGGMNANGSTSNHATTALTADRVQVQTVVGRLSYKW